MVFVPMVAHRAAPPSPRALDLARRLKDEVDKFEKQYPGTSREDLRTAADLAIGEEAGRVPPRRAVAAAVTGIIAALGMTGIFVELATNGGTLPPGFPVVAVAVGVASIAIIAAVVARSRRQG